MLIFGSKELIIWSKISNKKINKRLKLKNNKKNRKQMKNERTI